MASVIRDANGTKRVQFTDGDGNRKTIRLGKCSVKSAETFALRVEDLLAAQLNGNPWNAALSAWVRDRPNVIHARLARVGLVEPREDTGAMTLDRLLTRFVSSAVVKPSTRAAYRQTTESLRDHFGGPMAIDRITPAHADQWRKVLADSGLATATVAKRVHVAKTIFRKAVKWGLIDSSPFADLRAGSQCNSDRSHYVTVETIEAILAHCPDDQWRAIVALGRYTGLRCPSEIVGLRWGDVNWERGRLTVHSPKTAGHEGHAVRVVPLVPELRAILLRLFDEADEGAEWIVPRLRDRGTNLRTTFTKIIKRAGAEPWPRLFHNLRASCATDWCERFPAHVVAGWLGHSPLIAARHYLQTRDAHFELATGSGAECGAPEAQNAAQQQAASEDRTSHESPDEPVFVGVAQDNAVCDCIPQSEQVGATGFEPVTPAV